MVGIKNPFKEGDKVVLMRAGKSPEDKRSIPPYGKFIGKTFTVDAVDGSLLYFKNSGMIGAYFWRFERLPEDLENK